MLEKDAFVWSLINLNWRNKIYQKKDFFYFFLKKLWTYFNQTNKFKQTGIYSQKYML